MNSNACVLRRGIVIGACGGRVSRRVANLAYGKPLPGFTTDWLRHQRPSSGALDYSFLLVEDPASLQRDPTVNGYTINGLLTIRQPGASPIEGIALAPRHACAMS